MRQRTSFYLAAVAVLFTGIAAGAQASMQSDTGRTIVMASGTARQSVTPDRATLMLWIDTQGMSVDEAGARLATVERAVLDTLRRFNLGSDAVQSYNSGVVPFRTQNIPSAMMNGPSFSGRSFIRVDLPRVSLVGPVSGAALAKGVTFVAPAIFEASSADSVRRVLIPRAFEEARRDAEALARAAGGHLGRLVDVSAPQSPSFAQANQQIFVNAFMYDNGPRTLPSTTSSVTVTARWIFLADGR
ncbi:MAG: SIMPL domain-containing protein [Gemmatimonadales bacterium]